jgi:hypothetical protein
LSEGPKVRLDPSSFWICRGTTNFDVFQGLVHHHRKCQASRHFVDVPAKFLHFIRVLSLPLPNPDEADPASPVSLRDVFKCRQSCFHSRIHIS